MRKFALEEPIFVFSEFFGAFKKNLNIRGIGIGILSVILFGAFVFSLILSFFALNLESTGENYFNLAMTMTSGVVLLIVNGYVYIQMACLDLKISAMLKNAAILCVAGFKRNVITVFGFAAIVTLLLFALLSWSFVVVLLPLLPFAQLAFLSVFCTYPVIQKYIINPFYEAQGAKNPEIRDFEKTAHKTTALFTDLGGKETPIDKKKVKSQGKLIK